MSGPPPPVARDAIDAFGLDVICDNIADGKSLTSIAASIGVSKGSLLTWLTATTDRSARVVEARSVTAWHWDEEAQSVIEKAKADPVEMTRARELASHFRWRASKINPKVYSDRVQNQALDKNGNPTDPPTRVVVELVGR